jgi:hypothetical protein
LAGIDVDLSRPEWRQITIRPAFLVKVPAAQAEEHTVLGTVESSWTRDGEKVAWRIVIPVGSCAIVTFPHAAAKISMNERTPPQASPAGEVSLGSGSYEFRFYLRESDTVH